MQFTGHSLPVHQSMSVPWEFFSSSHFISQFPPTRFLLITAIRMCHYLPVHHLEWHFWPGRLSKYNKTTWNQLLSKQSSFLLQPLSSSLQSLSYSTRSLTQRSLSSSLVRPRLRRYCLRDVTHTTLLVHFTNADSAFQIHYTTPRDLMITQRTNRGGSLASSAPPR